MTIAVFLPNWIGDAVMATPAVRALREHFAGDRLIAVARPYVAGVFDGAPWFDHFIHAGGGTWSQSVAGVAWQLRRARVDVAVLFPNSFRSALTARLGGCRRRIGFARYGRSPLLTHRLQPIRDAQGQRVPSPVIDDYNRLAERAGCPRPSYRLELFTTPADEAAADEVWRGTGLAEFPEVVCLNPGAAFGSAKHWPADYFSDLARSLADRRNCGVLVLCGPGEREQARQIAAAADRPAVSSLAAYPLSLGLTRACVRRCELLVTTDSGPRHFGVAFDRPVVTLFGPTHIAWTETYHPRSLHLQKKVECGPCQLRVCPLDHRCMTELRPVEVLRAVEDLLARYPRRRAG
jgi:heptosyltransferase-2